MSMLFMRYLIDESNNLAPEPGQIQRTNIEPI